ncbi:MAG: GNAT family acetyltransferase [Desulfobacterales bacterium]|nr:GNAT family acetyltransferase [Desulfobacterales bacterium]
MISRLAVKNDIQGILDLQEINLFENLAAAEKENGFVTTPFAISQLKELLGRHGLFVAEDDQKITGYTMAAGWDYFSQWPIFPFMISRLSGYIFKGVTLSDQNTFQYGPICIDYSLRGTGAFPRLFEAMRIELSSRHPVGITFINRVNKRSYRAHTRKLGMAVIDEFEFSGREYYGLAFDTGQSVFPPVELKTGPNAT